MIAPRLPMSPTAAYRADMGSRTQPFGRDDDQWLAAAEAVHLAATGRATGTEHLYDALGIAIDTLGDERIDEFVEREWPGPRCYVESLVVLSTHAEDAGALNLAALMLDDLLHAATDLTPLHRGRILALRARLEWKLDRRDDARDRYAY